MTYRRPICVGLALLLTLPLLAGCSDGWRRTLGLEQTAPDEFKVAEREPLTMPPTLNELPTPRPGVRRPQATSPRMRAQQALFAATAPGQGTLASSSSSGGLSGGSSGAALSDGERRLLARANADAAPQDIRQTLAREAEERADALRGPLDDYLFWTDPQLPGEVVDANAEAKRLRDNQAQGKPLTEGEVPIQEREDRGLLGGL